MSGQPLISIIIPVYNVEQYLDECMVSVLNQTYTNIEIILVNDGSIDNSPAICDSYAMEDTRVKVIHKENGGPMSACMAGVEAATGEYLAFIDSDDWIDLNMMEELVKETSDNPKEMICSNYVIEKANHPVYVKQSLKPGVYDRKAIEAEIFPALLGNEERRIHGSRCMKLISRALVLENLAYTDINVSMGEDLFLIVLAVLDAHRIVTVEEGYYYHYRFLDSSLVHKYKPKMYQEIGILCDNLKKIISEKATKELHKKLLLQQITKEYIFLFFFVIKNELRGPWEGCISRIQKYVKEAKQKRRLTDIVVEVRGKANKLLYLIWKKPSVLRIVMVRWAIQIFDRL